METSSQCALSAERQDCQHLQITGSLLWPCLIHLNPSSALRAKGGSHRDARWRRARAASASGSDAGAEEGSDSASGGSGSDNEGSAGKDRCCDGACVY